MLNDIITAVLGALSALEDEESNSVFNAVEYYNGQLEDISNALIKPPHVYVEIDSATTDITQVVEPVFRLNVYLCSPSMSGTAPANAYSLIDDYIVPTLHMLPIGTSSYRGRVLWAGFNRLGSFPSFSVHVITFQITQ